MRLSSLAVVGLALLGGASAQYAPLPTGYASSTIPTTTQAQQTTTQNPGGVQYVPVPTGTPGTTTPYTGQPGTTPVYTSQPTTTQYPGTGTTQYTGTAPTGSDPCSAYGSGLVTDTAASTATNIVCKQGTGVPSTGIPQTGIPQTGTPIYQPTTGQPQEDPCTTRWGKGVITSVQNGQLICLDTNPPKGTTVTPPTTTTQVDPTSDAEQAKVCVGTFRVTGASCKATKCMTFQDSCKTYGFAITKLVKPSSGPVIVGPSDAELAKIAKAKAACAKSGISAKAKKDCKAKGYPLYDPKAAAAINAAKAVCLQQKITAKQKKDCKAKGYPLYTPTAVPAPAP